MKVLLDECVPKKLSHLLSEFDVQTVQQARWSGITNGELLEKACKSYDVFITVDRNLSFQQNASTLTISVIVLHSKSNRLKDLQKFIPEIIMLLNGPLSKAVYHIGSNL